MPRFISSQWVQATLNEKERKEFVGFNKIQQKNNEASPDRIDKQPKKKKRRRAEAEEEKNGRRGATHVAASKLSRYLRLICQNNKSFINFKGHAMLGSASAPQIANRR